MPTVAGLQGSSDSVTAQTQAFVSKNVLGAGGSTLTVTGYVVNDGNSGGNYTVAANPGVSLNLTGAAAINVAAGLSPTISAPITIIVSQ